MCSFIAYALVGGLPLGYSGLWMSFGRRPGCATQGGGVPKGRFDVRHVAVRRFLAEQVPPKVVRNMKVGHGGMQKGPDSLIKGGFVGRGASRGG